MLQSLFVKEKKLLMSYKNHILISSKIFQKKKF